MTAAPWADALIDKVFNDHTADVIGRAIMLRWRAQHLRSHARAIKSAIGPLLSPLL